MSKASNAVAALEDSLTQIKTAVAKDANDMHTQGGGTSGKPTSLTASTPAADDGDTSQPTGDLQREQIADVKDQQELSHEKETGAADSPAFNNAADSTGSVDENTADAEAVKNDADDDQMDSPSEHPARTDNSKLASLLKTAEELMGGDYDEEPPEEAAEAVAEEMSEEVAAGDGEGEGGEEESDVPDEELAQIEMLLGGADPKMAAAIPDLPEDDEAFTKVASEGGLDTYMEKVASTYSADVEDGFNFGHNLFVGLQKKADEAASGDGAEVEAIKKQAMADAGNVADVMAGMSGGVPEGAPEGVIPPEAMEGAEDPTAGGEVVPGEEEVPVESGEAGMGGELDAEALLAALQQAGIGDEQLMKVAAAQGLDEAGVKAVLAKARKA